MVTTTFGVIARGIWQMAEFPSTTDSKPSRSLAPRRSQLLVGTGLVVIGFCGLIAWPASPSGAEPTAGSDAAQSEAQTSPLAELTEALAAARDGLEELSRLTQGLASEKAEVDALEARNREILAEIQALHADRHQLRDARDAAITQSEDLGNALHQTTSLTHSLGKQLAAEREENARLLSQEKELAAQLESLTSAVAQAENEVAGLRGELESSQQRLAAAADQRAQADAELAALENRSSEAAQQITALETQVSALKDQLQEKQAALADLESVRSESEKLRDRLAKIETEIQREEDQNERLSAELAGFRSAAETVTDMARQHLLTVESKIRELNQAASAARLPDAEPSREPEAQPASGPKDEGELTDPPLPSASSGGGVGGPELPARGQADGYQLIPPAHAAEASPDRSLQVFLVEAMRKQREQLQGLMEELDEGPKAPR
jgi:predicted  nucleic acid-binding Zn-ribbon protein